jgi:hypothetical protein
MYFIPQTTGSQLLLLPYAKASVAQRELLLAYLRQRLHYHFPTLSPAAWLRALFEFQPTLVLIGSDSVTLDPSELQQLVNHLASSPELPSGTGGPRLLALLTYLCQPYPLAEQVIQAWRWDLASSPPLPPGLPGDGPIPGSEEVQRYLAQLGRAPVV